MAGPGHKGPEQIGAQGEAARPTRLENAHSPSARDPKSSLRWVWKQLGMRDVFDLPILERDKQIVRFLESANMEGVSDKDAFFFLDKKRNEWERRNGHDMSRDQLPGMIFVSSSTCTNVFDLFCAGHMEVSEGVAKGGVFGPSAFIPAANHLDEASDFTPVMYMLNHWQHAQSHGHFSVNLDTVPFIPSIGDYDPKGGASGHNPSAQEVAMVQMARLKELASKAMDQNHPVSQDPSTGHYMWNFHGNSFRLLPLVHDLSTGQVFVATSSKDTIALQLLTNFCEQNGMVTNDVARRYMANLLSHKQNEAAIEIIRRRKCCTTVCCVDSRCGRTNSGEARVIGSIPSEGELEWMIRNKDNKAVRINLHTGCGYIKTVIQMSTLLDELAQAAQKPANEQAVRELWKVLEHIVRDEKVPYLENEERKLQLAAQFGLEASKDTFIAVFAGIKTPEGRRVFDFQRTLKHMYDRGIMTGDSEQGFCMRPVKEVEHFLKANSIQLDQAHFTYLVTEQMGRDVLALAARVKEAIKARISSGQYDRITYEEIEQKKVTLVVDSLSTMDRFRVPPSLTVENATNFERELIGETENGAKINQVADVFRRPRSQ